MGKSGPEKLQIRIIYPEKERDRERETETERDRENFFSLQCFKKCHDDICETYTFFVDIAKEMKDFYSFSSSTNF